jgi:Hypoxia induced protein conserved region
MKMLLIPVLIGLMGLTLFTLLRGLNAFRQGVGDEPGSENSTGPTKLQLQQNQLMFKRILYQGAAIVVVFALLMAYR